MLAHVRDPRSLALGRTAMGLTMLVRPGLVPALLGVDRGTRERMSWVVQMLGAREVGLGLGTLTAGEDVGRWHRAGLVSDLVDALAVGAALRRGRVGGPGPVVSIAVAAGAVAVGVDALRR